MSSEALLPIGGHYLSLGGKKNKNKKLYHGLLLQPPYATNPSLLIPCNLMPV